MALGRGSKLGLLHLVTCSELLERGAGTHPNDLLPVRLLDILRDVAPSSPGCGVLLASGIITS